MAQQVYYDHDLMIEAGYKRQQSPIIGRIKAIWKILTTRNFILVHSIKNGRNGLTPYTQIGLIRRCDYNANSEMLALAAAYETIKQKEQIPEQNTERPSDS